MGFLNPYQEAEPDDEGGDEAAEIARRAKQEVDRLFDMFSEPPEPETPPPKG